MQITLSQVRGFPGCGGIEFDTVQRLCAAASYISRPLGLVKADSSMVHPVYTILQNVPGECLEIYDIDGWRTTADRPGCRGLQHTYRLQDDIKLVDDMPKPKPHTELTPSEQDRLIAQARAEGLEMAAELLSGVADLGVAGGLYEPRNVQSLQYLAKAIRELKEPTDG